MISDLVLSLILFGLSIASFVGVVFAFISKDIKKPIGFVVSILISLLCIELCYLIFKYWNLKCSTSASILFFGFAVASVFSSLYALLEYENGRVFVAIIMSFICLLGGIKFFPDITDIRFENPDCDFQQKQQTNKTVEHKSSEEKSLPVEQSEKAKQSSNNEVLILDKESKNLYKVDDVTTKQIIELLNKQEQ